MTDNEYREYLAALARTHVRPYRHRHKHPEGDELLYAIAKLSSTARFVRAVGERSDNLDLVSALAKELDNNWYVQHVVDEMRQSGVLSALDEAPDITFAELRRNAIPDEDVRLLRDAGVNDPEAEITILIHYARKRLGHREATPSAIAEEARDELKRAPERLNSLLNISSSSHADGKKKKIFNGIGKILAGTVTAAGNLLLATGTVIAPNPATAYGVIGSSALAVGSICQGVGDLRGE